MPVNVNGVSAGSLILFHKVLYDHFGEPGWWPGETPFEVCVGAILTQNTAWTNVEKAISNLKASKLLDPQRIIDACLEDVARAIRPVGYYNQKAEYLRAFCSYLVEMRDGDVLSMNRLPASELRDELLSLKGIGEETADSIICYALDRPVLVVDSYTFRSLGRFFGPGSGLATPGTKGSYSVLQQCLTDLLEGDASFYNRFHALIVLLAKEHCKKEPICTGCPLSDLCITCRR